jgi:hypothetical protein
VPIRIGGGAFEEGDGGRRGDLSAGVDESSGERSLLQVGHDLISGFRLRVCGIE